MMIGAELFRQGPRPLAMAVAGVVNWLGTFAIAMGFESVQVCLSLLKTVLFTAAHFLLLLLLISIADVKTFWGFYFTGRRWV